MSGDEQRERPRRAGHGGGDATGDSLTSTIPPPPAIVNAYYDRFRLDPDIDFALAGPDVLAAQFAADYFELHALQRRREAVTP